MQNISSKAGMYLFHTSVEG